MAWPELAVVPELAELPYTAQCGYINNVFALVSRPSVGTDKICYRKVHGHATTNDPGCVNPVIVMIAISLSIFLIVGKHRIEIQAESNVSLVWTTDNIFRSCGSAEIFGKSLPNVNAGGIL
jgi:hypothetical protein